MSKKMISGLLGMVLMGSLVVTQAGAVPARDTAAPATTGTRVGGDNRVPKFVEKWQAQKAAAADAVLRGEAKVRKNGTVKMPNGAFVDYELEDEDHIVTLLVDFTDPEHGQIEEPNRAKDNATYWEPNFDRAHYDEMLFSEGGNHTGLPSMRDFYLELSDGRYTVDGQVSEWLHIDAPESEYGANDPAGNGDDLNGPTYRVIADGLATITDQDEDINWDPAVVDVWDRFDCDADGNFDESDGYVDHFQMIHAGEGEEAGGGVQGEDAIWSHRSFANTDPGVGPEGVIDDCKFGGFQVPGSDLWVGDYTISPENGAVGVFSHEFGHDLGLPDLYDTSYQGESSPAFWSLMDSGSWGSRPGDPIGTAPTHMDAWSKAALGWVTGDDLAVHEYSGTPAAEATSYDLGPAEGATPGKKQVIRVNLPDYTATEQLVEPEGTDPFYYYSGSGNDLRNSMEHALDAPLAADTELTFRAWYDIEQDWDYAYVEASSNGGEDWTALDTNLSTDDDPNGQNLGHGITGFSEGFVDGTATVPAGTDAIRFYYWTDVAFVAPGFIVDSITLGPFVDDGSMTEEWVMVGFQQVEGGESTNTYFHYYLIESRNYLRNDKSLRGAYNFIKGDWLEKEPYADGVLIWYRDSRYADNDVGFHPGHGQILVVDAHPKPALMPDGKNYWRTRWQTWDSTFGTESHKIRLTQVIHKKWKTKKYKSGAKRVFYDTSKTAYWSKKKPDASTKTAGSGLWVKVKGGEGGNYTILIK